MNRPFSFKLRGKTWVCYLVQPDHAGLKMGDEYTMGMTHLKTNLIYVASDMSRETILAVLWHEVTHAILEPIDDALAEENVCNLMGDAMLELLPQTKRWPKWAK